LILGYLTTIFQLRRA